MRTVTIKVKRRYCDIRTCQCGIRFIEIQKEIDEGYARERCPWCERYSHMSAPPQMTHNWTPFADEGIISLT